VTDPAITHATFVVERSYKAPPAQVFAALSDPGIKRIWYADSVGHDVVAFDSDFRPGGVDRLHYRFREGTPFPGAILCNEGVYHDIVEDQRVVTTSAMTIAGRSMSVSLTTYELLPTPSGTDLICTNQVAFFEGSDGPVMREHGWRVLLDKLGKAVEGQ
jgi:uncharacterized protein YndB with AHSA1/START domain